jgi:hypothetical protein
MVRAIFDQKVHAKRIESLANGTAGAMGAARAAAIHAIGAAYAEVAETKPRHGVKQVDRYLRRGATRARLDRLRGRRPHHAVRLRGHDARARHAAVLADGAEIVAG